MHRHTARSRYRQALRVTGAVLTLLLAAAVGAETADPDAGALIERLHAIADAAHVAAFAVLVVDRDGIVLDYRGGLVERVRREPVGPRHRFRIGSITKTFNGIAAMRLAEAGALDLDQPVARLVAHTGLSGPGAEAVSTAQLLEHTAGLMDSIAADFGPHDPARMDLATALTLMPESRRLRWPPGRFPSYSNIGYGVAGRVLEVAGDTGYEALMQREVFAPLGMRTATVLQTPAVVDNLVHGYDSDGITPLPYWHMMYRSFGAITINPTDMAPLIRLFLNEGRHNGEALISMASVRRIETPATGLAARSGLSYGYGLGNYASYYRGHRFNGHGGDADGYLAKFGYSRSLGRGYFIVLNAFNNRARDAMHDAVRDFVIGGAAPPAGPARFPHADLAGYTGRFRPATQRFGRWPRGGATVEVVLQEDRLYTRSGSRRLRELVPVNAAHFRRPEQTGPTFAFVHDQDRLYLLGDIGNFVRDETPRDAPQPQPLAQQHPEP